MQLSEMSSYSQKPLESIIEIIIKYIIAKSDRKKHLHQTQREIISSTSKCEQIISEQLHFFHNFALVNLIERKLIYNSLTQMICKLELLKIYKLKMNCSNFNKNCSLQFKKTIEDSNKYKWRQGMERDENGEPTTEVHYKFQYPQMGPKEYKDKAASRLRDKEHVLLSSFSLPDNASEISLNLKKGNPETTPHKLKSKNDAFTVEHKYSLNIFRKNIAKCVGGFSSATKEETFEVTNEEPHDDKVQFGDKGMVAGANWDESPGKSETLKSLDHNFYSPLRIDVAYQLKKLIIGTAKKFPSQWTGQSFVFTNNHKVRYGLVQAKGGCCGVLAPVQAYVLKYLLYSDHSSTCESTELLYPSRNEVRCALVQALADILWQAGTSHATLAIADTETSEIEFNFERMLGYMTYKEYTTKKSLHDGITYHLDYFTTSGYNGCLLFVISVILSRGIQSVVGDMDDETCSLIGDNGFCSLELVNLLLTGYAVSNVFDNSLQIDSCTLRGIISRADIGFLSLYEHYNSCQVGSNLKTPRYPIWLVNSENHFTVLFSCQKELVSDWRAERQFVLYHYDAMHSNPDVKLTIDTTGLYETNTYQGENIPPLEHCIRTKWKDAVIKWHC